MTSHICGRNTIAVLSYCA